MRALQLVQSVASGLDKMARDLQEARETMPKDALDEQSMDALRDIEYCLSDFSGDLVEIQGKVKYAEPTLAPNQAAIKQALLHEVSGAPSKPFVGKGEQRLEEISPLALPRNEKPKRKEQSDE